MGRPLRESQERLFERFRRKGDVDALERVFDQTAPELMKLALHLVRDLEQAEDVVQATFLSAIESARAWDGTRRLLPWLLGILANHAGKARRAAGRRPDPERLVERRAPEPSLEAEREELDRVLARTLDELPQRYREVLVPPATPSGASWPGASEGA